MEEKNEKPNTTLFSNIIDKLKQNKKILIGIILLIVLFAAFAIWSLYLASKPQPIMIDYSVNKPSETDYEENKIYPLEIDFKGSAARLEDSGKVPVVPPVISPEIEGEWLWKDDSELVFTPGSAWVIGEHYQVKLPKELFPSHIEVADRSFEFDINPFQISFSRTEFYIDPEDSRVKRVIADISCNYPVDKNSVEDRIFIKPDIRAGSGGVQFRNYNFSTTFSDDGRYIYIVSEPVGMPAEDIKMEIIIEPGLVSAHGGKEIRDRKSSSVTVNGVSSYVRVNSIDHQMIKNEQMKYEQVVMINTKGKASLDEVYDNLELWLLPVDKPELPGLKGQKNYRWRHIDDVAPEVLNLSSRIKSEAIPVELEYNSINSFKIDATPDRYVYLKLKAGTEFFGGYYLYKDYETIFQLKDYPRELSILSEGSVLSLSGSKKLSMLSLGINAVDYTISRIRPDDLNHLVSQSNGNLSNFNFSNYRFNEYNISEVYRKTEKISNSSDPQNLTYFSFNFNDYLSDVPDKNLKHGLFMFEVEGERPYSHYSEKRFVLVTDLGIFIKTNDEGNKDIFVQSIADGLPVSGAVVELWGRNGNVVESIVTGRDGHVGFEGLSRFKNENSPTVWVVRKGNDLSFMSFEGNDRRLDYSDFDTGGIRGAQNPRTLTAFLFSDRGIYRPGDNFNIGMIIKAGDWGIDLADTPLECIISDPSGLQIYSEPIKLSSSGFEEINYRTQDYSQTGLYNVSLYVIKNNKRRDFLGSTQLKIEEFLPDTLNVVAGFTPKPADGWISPDDITLEVKARNLFGTAAEGNKVKLSMSLSPGYQYFRQYSDYEFFDPLLKNESYHEELGSRTTDAAGSVIQKINLGKFDTGTYNLRVDSEVFEKESGRSVQAAASVIVSPLKYLVGKKLDGSVRYINKNTERSISLIAVSDKLEQIEADDLKLRISEVKYVSSLVREPNGVYKYKSIKKEDTLSEESLVIRASGTRVNFPTGTAGEFVLSVVNDKGTVVSKTSFSIVGAENIQRSLDRTAELDLKLDKKDYKPGETAEIFIKAPYSGGGLITVERDKVYNYKWFTLDGSSTVQKIVIPEEMEGNGYITVSLTRSLDSNEIYMSPLSYGLLTFSVSKEKHTNKIEIEIPEEARPGEAFSITYSSSKSGRIAVFAVDEGILQVGRYETPDPISFFFKKRALEVGTSQILDLVLPEFDVVKALSAMGGGAGADELSRNLNPFKRKKVEPVAYWSGIIDCGPEKRTLEYMVPDYFNGSLRVMAVAVSQDALGAVDKSSLIRSPWVIQPNLPSMAAPGDEFDISVTVTNMNKGSGPDSKAVLKVDPGERLSIIGDREYTLSMAEGKDAVVKFKLKALDKNGGAELKFSVSGLGEQSSISSYLSIRPPVPYRTELQAGVVEKNLVRLDIDRDVYDDFAERKVSASYLPLSLADGLNFYLEKFPYGCTEQITSMTFPKLYPKMVEGLDMDRSEIKEDVNRTINILQARQKSSGAFGLWTSNSNPHPVIDSYVMHFLTLARENNYYVPESMFDKGLNRLREIASSKKTGENDLTDRCYAVYILTLNQIVTTSYIEKLTSDLKTNFEDWESGFCGMFLSGSYALMKQQREAESLIRKASGSIKREIYLDYYNELCYPSIYLYMLGEYFPESIKSVSADLLKQISEDIDRGVYSTFSANYAMLGISSYLEAVQPAVNRGLELSEEDAQKNAVVLKPEGDTLLSADYSAKAESVSIRNKDSVPLFYQLTSAGFDLEIPQQSNNGIEVFREYVTDEGEVVNELPVGSNINVRIRCRALESKRINNIAIVDLLPAGLEADIRSIRDSASSGNMKPEYIDIREDRVILFVDINQDMKEFTYKARAINTGSFVTPPAFAESMYDLDIWSLNPCERLVITE
ncbi:MAG: alpha-2-macroglobulin family protein [Spirochaetales bacterium]|nr:alpha-2-macroglobulin family protein [Spirochaetales bacterium]